MQKAQVLVLWCSAIVSVNATSGAVPEHATTVRGVLPDGPGPGRALASFALWW